MSKKRRQSVLVTPGQAPVHWAQEPGRAAAAADLTWYFHQVRSGGIYLDPLPSGPVPSNWPENSRITTSKPGSRPPQHSGLEELGLDHEQQRHRYERIATAISTMLRDAEPLWRDRYEAMLAMGIAQMTLKEQARRLWVGNSTGIHKDTAWSWWQKLYADLYRAMHPSGEQLVG